MKLVMWHHRPRRLVSSVLAIAMAFSLIVMPVGAAQPSSGQSASIVSGGTNLTALDDPSQSSNGLNGGLRVQVSGSAGATSAALSFVGSAYATYTVGACTLGSIDPFDGFVPQVSPAGFFTAVKLPAGYDIVLRTSGGPIADGTALVTSAGGVRDAAEPAFTVAASAGTTVAGMTTTITAVFTPMDGANESGIDAATFTLPQGFVPAQAAATAVAGSKSASVAVDPITRTVTVTKFFAKGADALTVQVASKVPTMVGDYAVTGTYRNVGATAGSQITAAGTIDVVTTGKVSEVRFLDDPMTGRPGTTATIGARLFDVYGNEITAARTVRASATSAMAPTQTCTVSQDAFYGYKTTARLPLMAGITTVKYSVFADDTTTTVEASDTVSISTVGVGIPAGLSVASSKNPASAETTVTFRVQLRDASGNITAYRAGELPAGIPGARLTLNYGPRDNAYLSQSLSITNGYSDRLVDLKSRADERMWALWAFDVDGALTDSNNLEQVWTGPAPAPVVYDAISVRATPMLAGEPAYGCARADGMSVVTFAVKTNIPKAGVKILASPANNNGPGVLTATTAYTDGSGTATFTVRSATPSVNGDMTKVGRAFKQFVFTDADNPAITTNGYAHFYAAIVKAVRVSSYVAFANGQDKITYTFTVADLVTGAIVAPGTRMYFKAAGWDATYTALSAPSGVTDVNGEVSVDITRQSVTPGIQRVWVVAQEFSGATITPSPSQGFPGVQFVDYVASADSTITAQQSTRGSVAQADFTVRDAAGNVVNLTRLTSVLETNTDVLKATPLTYSIRDSKLHLSVEVRADDANTGWAVKAGDRIHAQLTASAVVAGPLSSELPVVVGVSMPINIVNNAQVTGLGSVYLGKANITGTNLRPGTAAIKAVQGNITYTLTGTTIGIDSDGAARPQMFDLPFTMIKGTYDLVIDGMTFPGALVVGDGIAIGVNKVIIQLGASRGIYPYYATQGSEVTLFGVVSTAVNTNIPSAIVNVYSSASADGSNPTFIGAVLTSNGQFAYRIIADRGKYYFATTAPNSQYLAGDSRQIHGQALFVGVKTRAALRITSAPTSAIAGRAFYVRGTVPAHMYPTTLYVKAYRYQSGRWVYRASYSMALPAGRNTFYRSVALTSRGTWRLCISHADYDHVASTSAYRYVTVR